MFTLWELCEQAVIESDKNDWQAVRIDVKAMTQ